jgi:hypothetical protein
MIQGITSNVRDDVKDQKYRYDILMEYINGNEIGDRARICEICSHNGIELDMMCALTEDVKRLHAE